jgi:ribosome-binding protein aMBF1 (putative translation factor)
MIGGSEWLLEARRAVPAGSVEDDRQGSGLLLAWSQQELANKARVGIVTVHQLEAGTSQPRRATLDVIRHAFESAGVEFIDENGGGAGVRLRQRRRPKTPKK